jgi:hypothetical protein
VHFYSNHPSHIKRNVPYNLAFRIRKIVSEQHIRNFRYSQLTTNLLNLKYPLKLIQDAVRKAEEITTDIDPTVLKSGQTSILPYVDFYHKNSNQIFNTLIRPGFQLLQNTEQNKYKNKKLIKSYYRSPGILYLLKQPLFNKVKKCNKPKCKSCPTLIE